MLRRESLSRLRKSKYETKEQQIRNLFAAANAKFVRRPCSKGRKGLSGKRGREGGDPLGAPGAHHKVACLVLLVGQILACFDFQATHANAASLQAREQRTYTRSTKAHTTLYKTWTS